MLFANSKSVPKKDGNAQIAFWSSIYRGRECFFIRLKVNPIFKNCLHREQFVDYVNTFRVWQIIGRDDDQAAYRTLFRFDHPPGKFYRCFFLKGLELSL